MTAVDTPTTRDRLIDAATEVFGEQGYEGTRLQDIARAAGLTTGAVYSNFRNKGELLFEAIGTRSANEIDALLREVHGATLPSTLRDLGRRIVEREPRALLLDAVVAARRDPELAEHLRDRARGRETWLAEVTREAQIEGVVDASVDPDAVARLCTTIALGTLVARRARSSGSGSRRVGRRHRPPRRIARKKGILMTITADQHETIHHVEANIDAAFTWDYERSRDSLVRLYEKAKTSQWNVTTDLTGRPTSTPRRSRPSCRWARRPASRPSATSRDRP